MTAKNRGLAGGSLAAESTEAPERDAAIATCSADASVIDMDCGLRQALHFKGLHLTQSLHAFTPHWLHSQGSLA
jgi:hypothetical protein